MPSVGLLYDAGQLSMQWEWSDQNNQLICLYWWRETEISLPLHRYWLACRCHYLCICRYPPSLMFLDDVFQYLFLPEIVGQLWKACLYSCSPIRSKSFLITRFHKPSFFAGISCSTGSETSIVHNIKPLEPYAPHPLLFHLQLQLVSLGQLKWFYDYDSVLCFYIFTSGSLPLLPFHYLVGRSVRPISFFYFNHNLYGFCCHLIIGCINYCWFCYCYYCTTISLIMVFLLFLVIL